MGKDNLYNRKLRKFLASIVLFSIAAVMLAPIVVIFANSFMGERELDDYIELSRNSSGTVNIRRDRYFLIKLIPGIFTVEQYYNALFVKEYFLKMFWNSVIIAVPVIIGQLVISPVAAHAFAKMEFPFRNNIFILYVLVMLMPLQVTLVPNYIVLQKLGLLDSRLAIILPAIFNPLGVFLLRQFIILIPNDIIEAAKIDGASDFIIIRRIIIQMCRPVIIALVIMTFADNWNIVEQAVIFLDDAGKLPLSAALGIISANELDTAFASSALYMLPALAVYYYGRGNLIRGLKVMNLKV